MDRPRAWRHRNLARPQRRSCALDERRGWFDTHHHSIRTINGSNFFLDTYWRRFKPEVGNSMPDDTPSTEPGGISRVDGQQHKTPLAAVLAALGLKPNQVVRIANRIAAEMGFRRSISRQHFIKLRTGERHATEEKILLLVMAFRELSGYAVRASDLFALEPAGAAGGEPLLMPDFLTHGSNPFVPISSPGAGFRARRVSVSDQTGTSGDDAFE